MAMTSLLFPLAFVLTVASALAHEAPSPSTSPSASFSVETTAQFSIPYTVGELKTFPFVEITKFIHMHATMAPKTPEFGSMFSACEAYASFAAGFAKRGDFEFAFQGPFAAMYQMKLKAMSHALMTAQMAFGAEGEAALTLNKNFQGMIHGFGAFPAKIAEISARHQFDAAAKLSVAEQKEFIAVFGGLKKCISGYFKAAFGIAAKKKVAIGGQFGGKFGGHFGGHIGNFLGNFFGAGAGAKAGFDTSASALASGNIEADGKEKLHY